MKMIFNAASLQHRSNRELEGMKAEIRKDLGACEQRRRHDQAALGQIRTAQGLRRHLRPNA
jgi:hypothetical protein